MFSAGNNGSTNIMVIIACPEGLATQGFSTPPTHGEDAAAMVANMNEQLDSARTFLRHAQLDLTHNHPVAEEHGAAVQRASNSDSNMQQTVDAIGSLASLLRPGTRVQAHTVRWAITRMESLSARLERSIRNLLQHDTEGELRETRHTLNVFPYYGTSIRNIMVFFTAPTDGHPTV